MIKRAIKWLLLETPLRTKMPEAWKANRQNLYSVNFDKAPWKEIDLSGTQLRFKHARQTAMFPNDLWIEAVNIWVTDEFNPWDGGMTKVLYRNGWNYTDGLFGDDYLGGGVLHMIIQRIDLKKAGVESLLNPESARSYLLEEIKTEYKAENHKRKTGDYVY
ncbi:hypothetical protein, partial [Endozoicomonas numazuensis]|uniref:hypothetical protein n=1 Tax=Endozoicomonas numazuensis TaxID=1137799 RepID=UPI0005513D0F